jgi:hypothetical protein
MCQFEYHTCGAKILGVSFSIRALRVDDRDTVGFSSGGELVMIDNDDINSFIFKSGYLIDGCCSTIHGDQQTGFLTLFHAAFKRSGIQAVALSSAAGDKASNR